MFGQISKSNKISENTNVPLGKCDHIFSVCELKGFSIHHGCSFHKITCSYGDADVGQAEHEINDVCGFILNINSE